MLFKLLVTKQSDSRREGGRTQNKQEAFKSQANHRKWWHNNDSASISWPVGNASLWITAELAPSPKVQSWQADFLAVPQITVTLDFSPTPFSLSPTSPNAAISTASEFAVIGIFFILQYHCLPAFVQEQTCYRNTILLETSSITLNWCLLC